MLVGQVSGMTLPSGQPAARRLLCDVLDQSRQIILPSLSQRQPVLRQPGQHVRRPRRIPAQRVVQ